MRRDHAARRYIRRVTQPFHEASYLAQVARLRRVAEIAAERFGLRRAKLRLMRHWMNATFRARDATGQAVIRVHLRDYHDRAAIESELDWLEAIDADTPLRVPRPRRASNDERIIEVEAPRLNGPRRVTALSWTDGRFVTGRSVRPEHYRRVGQAMATLHTHATAWRRPVSFDRPLLDVTGLAAKRAMPLIDMSAWDRLDAEARDAFEAVVERALAAERAIGDAPDRFNLMHADLHFGNVLFQPDATGVIDFDDAGVGPLAIDLAVALAGTERRPGHGPIRRALLDGYRSVRPLSDTEVDAIDAFIALRDVQLTLWILTHEAVQPLARGRGQRRVDGALGRIGPFLRGEPQPE